jgi:hypothetical protein
LAFFIPFTGPNLFLALFADQWRTNTGASPSHAKENLR